MKRDGQRSKVYAWEGHIVAPLSKRSVPFEAAQAFVDGVWLAHGWLYPPHVALKAKQATRTLADGCRGEIRIRPFTPDWLILHELAHALTSDHDGCSSGHGADFVGMYIKLLDKVMRIPLPLSLYTLQQKGIKFNLFATPWMMREHRPRGAGVHVR
jgi:hypothetical protein